MAANSLLYVGFNQDQGCFAVGTDSGFRIYNCDPFRETFRRDFPNGGIGIVEMLFRCNILALVGGGTNPRYPPHKVMVWDDHQNRCIGELSFRSEVKAVKLRRDRIVVVLETKIYVYNFADLKLVDQIDTISNPKGLCALSPSGTNNVVACPGRQHGHVHLELYDTKKTTLVKAHETELACMALNLEGTWLATASEKGTLIRIFDTTSGAQLRELRRGADKAVIYSITFNHSSDWLAVSSDKGTVHVFAIDAAAQAALEERAAPSRDEMDAASNQKSSFSFLKNVLPKYFSSEWSFAQFRVPDDMRTICAFGADRNSLIVVSASGAFYKCYFDPRGGDCRQETYARFIEPE